MLNPVRVTAPAELPVGTDALRAHLSIDFTDDLLQLAAFNEAATAYLDGWSGILGRCLVSQQWRVDLCNYGGLGKIRLPFPDVSAAEIKYFDSDDVEQTVSPDHYEIHQDALGSFIWFKNAFSYPVFNADRLDAVRVTFTAGYGAASDVPAAIKQAIKMLVAFWYENRESANITESFETPFGVKTLLAPYFRKRL